MTTKLPLLSLLLLLPFVGCAAAPGGSPDPGDGSSVPADPPASAGPSLPVGEVPNDLVAQVIADAAAGAGVEESEVQLVSAEAVTWSDGSLGCPEPGMMYTQALVPGYRVVLSIDGEELSFHAAESGEFSFCQDPKPPAEDG